MEDVVTRSGVFRERRDVSSVEKSISRECERSQTERRLETFRVFSRHVGKLVW